jgi:hypothetical protein
MSEERHVFNLSCEELMRMASMMIFFFTLIRSPLFVRTLTLMMIMEPKTFHDIMAASTTIGGLEKYSREEVEAMGLEGMNENMHKNMKVLYELMQGQVMSCKEGKN